MKTHVAYAVRAGEAAKAEAGAGSPLAVPHLGRVAPAALARQVAARGGFDLTAHGLSYRVEIPATAAPLIAAIDARRTLGTIAEGAGLDWLAFAARWNPVDRALRGFNLLHYSRGARR
jgi:hypothetical protein